MLNTFLFFFSSPSISLSRMGQRTYLLESNHLYSVKDLRQVTFWPAFIAYRIRHLKIPTYRHLYFFISFLSGSRGPVCKLSAQAGATCL